jgi:hypothetical protein
VGDRPAAAKVAPTDSLVLICGETADEQAELTEGRSAGWDLTFPSKDLFCYLHGQLQKFQDFAYRWLFGFDPLRA